MSAVEGSKPVRGHTLQARQEYLAHEVVVGMDGLVQEMPEVLDRIAHPGVVKCRH